MVFQKAAVIGGGSFGTVVANILADNNIRTVQWMRNEAIAREVNEQHQNSAYVPGVELNPELTASTNLVECVTNASQYAMW